MRDLDTIVLFSMTRMSSGYATDRATVMILGNTTQHRGVTALVFCHHHGGVDRRVSGFHLQRSRCRPACC